MGSRSTSTVLLTKLAWQQACVAQRSSLNFVVPMAATTWEATAPMTRTKKNKEALSDSVNVQNRVRSDRPLRQLTGAIDFSFVGNEY